MSKQRSRNISDFVSTKPGSKTTPRLPVPPSEPQRLVTRIQADTAADARRVLEQLCIADTKERTLNDYERIVRFYSHQVLEMSRPMSYWARTVLDVLTDPRLAQAVYLFSTNKSRSVKEQIEDSNRAAKTWLAAIDVLQRIADGKQLGSRYISTRLTEFRRTVREVLAGIAADRLTYSADAGTLPPVVIERRQHEAIKETPKQSTIQRLEHIGAYIKDVQNSCTQKFQSLLAEVAGTTRDTYEENKVLLQSVQDVRKRLGLAFVYRKGRSPRRVNVLLTRSRGSGVGTFSVFTTAADREYLYHGAEFPSLEVFDPASKK